MAEAVPGLMTVCIVTYEGERWIEACIRSVLRQSYRQIEVIVHDNASRDRTLEMVRSALEGAPGSQVLQSDRNLGFARAHNAAIARASGEYVCLLNQDAVLDDGYVGAAVAALGSDDNIGAVQGLILHLGPGLEPTDIVDSAGLVLHRNRRIVSRAQGVSAGDFDEPPGPVFGPDGPAPVYRMSALASARVTVAGEIDEILDESFFLYHEDTDLAWRLDGLGWTTWYEPTAIAWHARGSSGPKDLGWLGLARHGAAMSEKARVLSWRNQRLSILKNDRPDDYLGDLGPIAVREVGSTFLLLASDPRRIRVVWSLIRLIPQTLKKRRRIRFARRASARRKLLRWHAADRVSSSPRRVRSSGSA